MCLRTAYRIATIFFLIAFIATGLIGQAIFRAYSDAKQVIPDHYFQVTFSLENAKGLNFKAPSFMDFEVVGGPSSSSQISIVNGQRSHKMSYTYTLVAEKAGTFTIGPAEIQVNGNLLKTSPIKIQVVQGKLQDSNSNTVSSENNGAIFLEAHLDYDTGYVGQQITLRYDLITNLDVRSSVLSKVPDFDGFYAQELQGTNLRAERIVRDGVQYIRRPIKVYALFPQQKGIFKLESAQSISGITDGRQPRNFFFTRRLKQIRSNSEPLTIHIKDLPEPVPVSFSGAVGKFRMNAVIDKKSVTMDDAVTLTMTVQGMGDGKFIEAPAQPFESDWDIYEPNLLNEQQQVVGDEIRFSKTFEYLMIPKQTGRQIVQPEFSYYNVENGDYETLQSNPMTINILRGTGREIADVQNKEVVLAPIFTKTKFVNPEHTFAFSPLHIGINGALGLSVLGLLLYKRRQTQLENIDPLTKRKEKAKKVAVEKLSEALKALNDNNIEDFYIQLRRALTNYLADKTGLASDQLSKNDIDDLLTKHNISHYSADIQEIMQKGEQALYASIRPGQEKETYQRTLDIILDIESGSLL